MTDNADDDNAVTAGVGVPYPSPISHISSAMFPVFSVRASAVS